MSALDPLRNLAIGFANFIVTQRRLSQFTCSDCTCVDRCGRPPSERCPVRLMQVARGDWRARRSAQTLVEW